VGFWGFIVSVIAVGFAIAAFVRSGRAIKIAEESNEIDRAANKRQQEATKPILTILQYTDPRPQAQAGIYLSNIGESVALQVKLTASRSAESPDVPRTQEKIDSAVSYINDNWGTGTKSLESGHRVSVPCAPGYLPFLLVAAEYRDANQILHRQISIVES
jgi:hypothetical protein